MSRLRRVGEQGGHGVANREAELLCQIDTDYGRIALEIELAEFDEFADRNDLLFLGGINPPDHWRETPVLKFHDHRPLDVGSGRDYAGSVADLYCEITPIGQDPLGRDLDVRVEVDHFPAQLAIEARHDRNDEDEDGHAQGDPEDRDERNDGNESALRSQVAEREKETERKFQGSIRLPKMPLFQRESLGFGR